MYIYIYVVQHIYIYIYITYTYTYTYIYKHAVVVVVLVLPLRTHLLAAYPSLAPHVIKVGRRAVVLCVQLHIYGDYVL